MENNMGNQNNENIVWMSLESQIRNNNFKSKEELTNRIFQLKQYGRLNSADSSRKIQELLNLYDSLYKVSENPLNTEKYKSVKLEQANLIVSTESDSVLKTLGSPDDMQEEFRRQQNESTANSQDGLVNADTVYKHMAYNQKEEIKLIPIFEALSREDIDIEVLKKMKFFITNKYVNPFQYRVDTATGIFYNLETNEALEVRKNPDTGKYEIYRGRELVYDGNNPTEEEVQEKDEEEQTYENRKSEPKVRKLVPNYLNDSRAAFSKISFLILNILTFIILVIMIVLLNK